jgi:hypothetical protein
MIVKQIAYTLAALAVMACGICVAEAAQPLVDNAIYFHLLQAHVNNGRVDYRGFKEDEQQLDNYLAVLESVRPDALSKPEQMAFYINAYNAWTIKLILSAYPELDSIKDLGGLFSSPWKKSIVKLNNSVVTLDHIEHDILRPRFKDPRIHFAINCASISCPPLLNEPYEGTELNRQLNQVTKDFINDPNRNYIKGNSLYVSRIFKWFREDFNGDVLSFFKRYAEGNLLDQLNALGSDAGIEYLPYNWGLNSVSHGFEN